MNSQWIQATTVQHRRIIKDRTNPFILLIFFATSFLWISRSDLDYAHHLICVRHTYNYYNSPYRPPISPHSSPRANLTSCSSFPLSRKVFTKPRSLSATYHSTFVTHSYHIVDAHQGCHRSWYTNLVRMTAAHIVVAMDSKGRLLTTTYKTLAQLLFSKTGNHLTSHARSSVLIWYPCWASDSQIPGQITDSQRWSWKRYHYPREVKISNPSPLTVTRPCNIWRKFSAFSKVSKEWWCFHMAQGLHETRRFAGVLTFWLSPSTTDKTLCDFIAGRLGLANDSYRLVNYTPM